MNSGMRRIAALCLLAILLIAGCAEEVMMTPTPIAYFTPTARPQETGEQAATPLAVAPTSLPTPAQTPQIVDLTLPASDPVQPTIIALATVALDDAAPMVVTLDTVPLAASQPTPVRLRVGDPTVIQPAVPLALTDLQIIHPDVGGATVAVGAEAGMDRVDLPLPAQTVAVVGPLIQASSLTGRSVVNRDNQSLGTLDDLILNLADGYLLFATVIEDGLLNLNLGSRTLPVPPTTLTWDRAREQVGLRWTDAELARIEGFDNRWPQLDNPDWGLDTLSAWRELDRGLIPETAITYARTTPATVRRFSTLLGESVYNTNGEELTRVDDLLIDLETGLISYFILARGGWLGLGDDQIAVPFAVFEFVVLDENERAVAVILNATQDDLTNAPVYTVEESDLDDPEWGAPFNRYWTQTIQPEPIR